MAEQIMEGIYRIGVTLPNNPLKELNAYLIKGEERDLLIDTGFRLDVCREALFAGLEEVQAKRDHLDVLLTHLHADHSGLSREAASADGHIYVSEVDLARMKKYMGRGARSKDEKCVKEGLPPELLERIARDNPVNNMALKELDDRFTAIHAGDILQVGKYRLEAIATPGHTPGNQMYWMEEQKVMFTGDHILFDISPNITDWDDVEDSLGLYLESLKRVRSYPVETALPGHRKPGNYKERIDALLAHHDRRLRAAWDIVQKEPGLSAYQITARMKWKIHADSWEQFPPAQMWFALGECLAHLDHLRVHGLMERREENGYYFYYVKGDINDYLGEKK